MVHPAREAGGSFCSPRRKWVSVGKRKQPQARRNSIDVFRRAAAHSGFRNAIPRLTPWATDLLPLRG